MKRRFEIAAIIATFVGFLAVASFFTTSIIWDGGFPSGEFRINIRNPEREPVIGAVLRVYQGGSRELAFNYPLDNHKAGVDLISDDMGQIIAIRKDGGLQFGGHAWRLFWAIPIGARAPQYDCEVTAEGFKPLNFSIGSLFKSPYRYNEDYPKTNLNVGGKEIQLPVYEYTLTVER